MSKAPLQLGFLASNNGSSMRAIIGAIEARRLAARVRLVVSNKKQATALAFARQRGLPTLWIPTVPDPVAADARLAAALADAGVELVILSGFLRKLGPLPLRAYRNRILNIHPGLLPKHGGPGMYGRHVHAAVLRCGDHETGATVHLVDDQYDHGPVVAQVIIPIDPGDTVEAIEARVIRAEPMFYVETLQRLAAGDLTLAASRD